MLFNWNWILAFKKIVTMCITHALLRRTHLCSYLRSIKFSIIDSILTDLRAYINSSPYNNYSKNCFDCVLIHNKYGKNGLHMADGTYYCVPLFCSHHLQWYQHVIFDSSAIWSITRVTVLMITMVMVVGKRDGLWMMYILIWTFI